MKQPSLRCVSIKLKASLKRTLDKSIRLRDASLRQKSVQLLGNVYMLYLAVKQITFLPKKKKNGLTKFTCYSWPVSPFSVMSAVEDGHSDPEVTTKPSSPHVNVTASTTLTPTGLVCTGEAVDTTTVESRELHALLMRRSRFHQLTNCDITCVNLAGLLAGEEWDFYYCTRGTLNLWTEGTVVKSWRRGWFSHANMDLALWRTCWSEVDIRKPP